MPMSSCVEVNLGHGFGGLQIGGLPLSTYLDASFSQQTFVFTDSPDESLQERLGNCLAGEGGWFSTVGRKGCDGALGPLGISSPAFVTGDYLVPRNSVCVEEADGQGPEHLDPHSICCLSFPGRR